MRPVAAHCNDFIFFVDITVIDPNIHTIRWIALMDASRCGTIDCSPWSRGFGRLLALINVNAAFQLRAKVSHFYTDI